MNMLGKILVVLIFVMSIFFMAFSFMVFMTQTSWQDKAAAAASDLQNARTANSQLEAEISKIRTERAAANAARKNTIALLEANLSTSTDRIAQMQQQLNQLRAQQAQQGLQVTGSLQTLQAERQKVDALREQVKVAQSERDKMFAEVVDLKNQLLELEAVRERLAASEAAILAQLGKQQAVLRANDLSEHDDISGVAPPRDGKVRQVDALNKFVVLSLGSDDGLRPGHTLDVHRGSKYLGRVELTKTHKDRSIGIVLNDFRKGAIRSGDSVRTK